MGAATFWNEMLRCFDDSDNQYKYKYINKVRVNVIANLCDYLNE